MKVQCSWLARGVAGAIVLVGIASLTPLACGPGPWDYRLIEQSKCTGDTIVKAINGFRRDNGHYPERLVDLVPKYLTQIDRPKAGDRKWEYFILDEGKAFSLSFQHPFFMKRCYYHPRNHPEWVLTDSSF